MRGLLLGLAAVGPTVLWSYWEPPGRGSWWGWALVVGSLLVVPLALLAWRLLDRE